MAAAGRSARPVGPAHDRRPWWGVRLPPVWSVHYSDSEPAPSQVILQIPAAGGDRLSCYSRARGPWPASSRFRSKYGRGCGSMKYLRFFRLFSGERREGPLGARHGAPEPRELTLMRGHGGLHACDPPQPRLIAGRRNTLLTRCRTRIAGWPRLGFRELRRAGNRRRLARGRGGRRSSPARPDVAGGVRLLAIPLADEAGRRWSAMSGERGRARRSPALAAAASWTGSADPGTSFSSRRHTTRKGGVRHQYLPP